MDVNFVLAAHPVAQVIGELGRVEELLKLLRSLKGNFMTLGHHAKESVHSLRHLILGSGDGDNVTRLLGAGEVNLAVPFLFELVNFRQTSDEFSMVKSVDNDGFRDEFRILRSNRLV